MAWPVHAGQIWNAPWLGLVLPLVLLLVGLPLAFLATGLKLRSSAARRYRHSGQRRLAGRHAEDCQFPPSGVLPPAAEDDDERHEPYADDEDDDGYHLDEDEMDAGQPVSVADKRLAERRETRIKRDAAKKTGGPEKRKQTGVESGQRRVSAAGAGFAGRAGGGEGHASPYR